MKTTEVKIPTQDGVTLSASFTIPKNNCPFVIIMGGYGGVSYSAMDGKSAVEIEKRLAEIGIGSIRFNYRGIGKSTGKWQDINITSSLKDLQTICEYVRKLDVDLNKIGLTSSSYSGGISIYVASLSNFFKVLVTSSAVMDWRELNKSRTDVKGPGFNEDADKYNFYEAAKQVRIPTLVIHKTDDDAVPSSQSETLYENLQCEKKLELINGKGHNYEGEEFQKRINLTINWIQKHLV